MLTPAPRPNPNRPLFPALKVLLAGLALFCCLGSSPAQSKGGFTFRDYGSKPKLTPPDEIKARGALLIDADTGEVLYARNPDGHFLPASTTKLMTALIVYEKVGLKGNVTVTVDDTRVEPSSVPLMAGETVSVNKLFNALLIESANDSARTLGRSVAGSTDAFIKMMNQRALAMGCFNTHFANPNGLPAPAGTHYTSCADLMRIFRAVIAYPDLRRICSTKDYVLSTAAKTQTLHNHNRLLGYYPGMGPAKTGWTIASRHTYAASVTQHDRQLLLTLLDSPNKWSDAMILFNWGFAQKPSQTNATPLAPAIPPAPSGLASSSPPLPAPAAKPAAAKRQSSSAVKP